MGLLGSELPLSAKGLSQKQVSVTSRIIRQLRDDLKAELAIEVRRLEAMCHQDKLRTTSASSFSFGRGNQTAAESCPAL